MLTIVTQSQKINPKLIFTWTPDLKFDSNVRVDRPSRTCCKDASQMFKATNSNLSIYSYIYYITVFLEEQTLHQNKWIHFNKFSVWAYQGVSLPEFFYDKKVIVYSMTYYYHDQICQKDIKVGTMWQRLFFVKVKKTCLHKFQYQ